MIKVFYNTTHRLHAPQDDFEDDAWYPYVEVPERIEVSLAALETMEGVELVESGPAPKSSLLKIHDHILVEGLEKISRGLRKGEVYQLWPFRERIFADLSAPVTAGTFPAALASAGCALAAAGEILDGGKFSIALCRPPGHHAGKAFCGGYCYFNNAALAAQKLLARGRVGILDLDYHHGHGTQDIFYNRSDVVYASLHADPAIEYPYRWGYAHERGGDQGEGYNLNLPLKPKCGETQYFRALEHALTFLRQKSINALVVSLGFDTHRQDPYSGFGLASQSFMRVGRSLVNLGLPMIAVFEGGYNLSVLGACWREFVLGVC